MGGLDGLVGPFSWDHLPLQDSALFWGMLRNVMFLEGAAMFLAVLRNDTGRPGFQQSSCWQGKNFLGLSRDFEKGMEGAFIALMPKGKVLLSP